MHNNYYFLRHVSTSLEKILTNAVISECFSQNKDELIVRSETNTGSFYIKAVTSPAISCLTFSTNFDRARRNSVDLFPSLIGLRVQQIRQFKNERSFAINLTDNFSLLFKMHGNMANIILLQNGKPADLFRSTMEADWNITHDNLDREIDWSYEAFLHHQKNLSALYFTFGKRVWQFLELHAFSTKSIAQKWEMILQVKSQLENPEFYITYLEGLPRLSLLKLGTIKKELADPLQASNDFFNAYMQVFSFVQQKNEALAMLKAGIQSGENYIRKNSKKLQELKENDSYKVWADLIMANLHAIRTNTEEITLQNFYNENFPVTIRLKQELSPQKNAEVYYRKSKNQQIEIDNLEQGIRTKQAEIESLREKQHRLEKAEDLQEVKKINVSVKTTDKKQAVSLPYHEFIVSGFKIWVGRNAESNDVLTLKYSFKEDLWLHAKDVAGSHVLIKHQAGKNFPKDVIERAAQLAAYNSKRKNETLAPVIVTPKKFVRKRKGDPAGAVVVEKETVIMVVPQL